MSELTVAHGREFYGEDLAAIHASGFLDMARAAAEEVIARLSPDSRVLDLGCGDGTTAGLIAARGHDVVGVDRSPAMIALARDRHPGARFHLGDDTSPDLPRGVDAVLAVGEVLAYLEGEPERLEPRLARLMTLLRPGGLLLFDLPAPTRIADDDQRNWTVGDGWAVLAATTGSHDRLRRDIITFRRQASGDYRRTDEQHHLALFASEHVLAALAGAGAREPVALHRYASLPLPVGLIAYTARKPPTVL